MSQAIQNIFEFIDYDYNIKISFEDSLKKYLELLDKIELFSNLNCIINELINNAIRANLKRVYFLEKKIDIKSEEHYNKNLENFKNEINNNFAYFVKQLEKNKFFVNLKFYEENNNFIIRVTNNNELLDIEKKNILNRIKIALQYNKLEEAINNIQNSSEGFGLGIILIIFILKSMGLNEKNIIFKTAQNKTEVIVFIPLDILSFDKSNIIATEIVKEIDTIPQFPQHIMEIINYLNNPNNDFLVISKVIKKDPALITDILRVANSSYYSVSRKVSNIEEAVRLVGLKAIKNIVITHASNKIFMNKYNLNAIKDIMKHSQEVAIYALELAKFSNLKMIFDNVYVCAMLHDFGKIIVKAINEDILEKIKKVSIEKGISDFTIESLTNGYNHSLIGEKLARKWNLPDFLVNSIKYHHKPIEYEGDDKSLIYVIYLANIIFYYKRNEIKYEDIYFQVLYYLGFNDKNKFDQFVSNVNKVYQELKDKI